MKALTIAQILEAVNQSEYHGSQYDLTITQVEFDSRKINTGTLFVPLTGGTTDGHSYINAAIEKGASVTFWQKGHELVAPTDQIEVIYVDDTLLAFQELAHFYRQLLNPTVIGITGSNGKTTTKDMTANVLTTKFRVHKTQGNYNNEIGVPYTILEMPEDTEVLVCEMGMSGFGEIAELSRIAEPNIAVITLIGESHLEHLGSREGIAQAKLEILEGVRDDAVFIYPHAEALIKQEWPQDFEVIKRIGVGFTEDADVYAYDLTEEQSRTYFRTNLESDVLSMIPIMGAYNVSNALIALTVARELGVPTEQAIFQLAQFKLTANRLEWLKTEQGAQLLNDAYNASLTSMSSVIRTFSNLALEDDQQRSLLIGDIRELGPESEAMHRSLKEAIDPSRINKVYLFGEEMGALYEELQYIFKKEDLFYEATDHQLVINKLENTLNENDLILVKSSFGTDLLSIVSALTGVNTK